MTRIACALAFALWTMLSLALPALAQSAGAATTTRNVNLREGPGTRYAVVRVVRSGERVNIARCAGTWCLVDAGRDRGWLAQAYIRRVVDVRPPMPAPDFGGGVSIGRGQACFYELPRFRGRSFCLRPGQDEPDLFGWRTHIGSVEMSGRVRGIDLCAHRNFRRCTAIWGSQINLDRHWRDIASLRVW